MILAKLVKLHYWPGITCVWFITTFIVTYFIAVANGHVYPYFPFISDSGSVPPESCIFGEMMNIGAVLMGIIVYIRHRQLNFAIKSDNLPLNKMWNVLATIAGGIACIGLTFVANFQETAVLAMHVIGAIMLFGCGALFILMQTRITYAFKHIYNKKENYWIGPNTLYIRIIITIIFCLLYSSLVICGFTAVFLFTGETIIYWTEEHGGYYEHLAATISEWTMVISFFIYLLSFTPEFKSLEYEAVRFTNKCIDSNSNKQDITQPKMCLNDSSYL